MERTNQKSLKSFFILWSGQALSLLGSCLVQFALIWWLTRTTESATILALASLVGLLPQVVLGPFVEVLVDRWQRRRVMLLAHATVALATLPSPCCPSWSPTISRATPFICAGWRPEPGWVSSAVECC